MTSKPADEQRAEQRAVAQRLITRAREDRRFAQRVLEDPDGVLAEAGLPTTGADDLLREAPRETRDPSAEAICTYTCEWTCIWTS
jgi:hypothetical protein